MLLDRAPAALPGVAFPVKGIGRGSRALAACWSSWLLLLPDLVSVSALTRWSSDVAESGFDLSGLPRGPGEGVKDMMLVN